MTSVSTDRRLGVNSGAALKVPCRAASTANLTLSGEQTIDGVACVTGDRVLVKNQTSGAQNGIYIVDTGTWGRAPDWDGAYDVVTGTAVYITSGSSNAGTYWAVTTTGTITVGTTSVAFTNAVISSAASISTIQSGIGASTRTVEQELRETISPLQFGGLGDGATNDSAAILAASVAAVAQGKDVDFGGHTWLVGTQIAITSAHSGLCWRLRGATIKKGFSGDLMTVTNTVGFRVVGTGTFHGQHGTYTGKGIVVSGSGSIDMYLAAGILFDSFTDTHLEFGADAGKYCKIEANFRAATSPAQPDARMILCTGPDTNAMQRDILGSMNGYISLTGTNAVHVKSPLLTRVEIASTCNITLISGASWSNGSAAMTLSGTNSVIIGCRFAGDVTLDANFSGVFVGNTQTAGTFTNSTVGGSAIVIHHDLAAVYERFGRHKFRTTTVDDMVQYSRTTSIGNADATFTPTGSAPMLRWANTLTADRTVTLADAAFDGDRCLVTRSGGGAFNGLVKRANGFLLANILQNGWAMFENDGSSWNCIASGQITGGNKALWSTTTTGNIGGGTDDLISLTLWGGAIGDIIGDAFGVSRGVRIKAWGSTANNANAKTVTLVAGASTILTTALTANQASTWEIEATVLSTGDNTQKYTSRMLQGGATTITDLENGTLALTDANTIAIKCTGAGTNDNDIVQEGMTIEFIN